MFKSRLLEQFKNKKPNEVRSYSSDYIDTLEKTIESQIKDLEDRGLKREELLKIDLEDTLSQIVDRSSIQALKQQDIYSKVDTIKEEISSEDAKLRGEIGQLQEKLSSMWV